VLILVIAALAPCPLLALQAGQAAGTASVDGTTATLAFAVSTTKENLFDDSKRDTVVVVTDRALGDTAADDEVGLSMRARRGELLVLALRLDGTRLVNVSVSHEGLTGIVKLPGAWFEYKPGKAGDGTVTGSLKLAKRESDGHSYACSVEFVAFPAAAPVRASAAEAPAAVQPTLKLIKLGSDPNGRDQYGTPVLNWAVMMCQPRVLNALVDAKASLTYQRAPGMTILQEAGVCPEAAKILRAAGAH
jgi:hypothetical protein